MFAGFLASSKSFLADVQSTVSAVLEDEKAQYEAEKARIAQQRADKEAQANKEKSREGVALWSVWGTGAAAARGAAAASTASPASPSTAAATSNVALEKELQSKILKLSSDRRTFLSPAPDSSAFEFHFESSWPLAQFALRSDAKLERARFLLVPRKVSEQVFWRNYLYRVECIRRTAKVQSIFDMPEEEVTRRKQQAAANMPLAQPAVAAANATSARGAAKVGAAKPTDDVSHTHTLLAAVAVRVAPRADLSSRPLVLCVCL